MHHGVLAISIVDVWKDGSDIMPDDLPDEFRECTASSTTRIKSTIEDFDWELHMCREVLRIQT